MNLTRRKSEQRLRCPFRAMSQRLWESAVACDSNQVPLLFFNICPWTLFINKWSGNFTSVSVGFFLTLYFFLFLFCPIQICLFLFYLFKIIVVIQMPVCFIVRGSKRGCEYGRVVRIWEESGEGEILIRVSVCLSVYLSSMCVYTHIFQKGKTNK